VVAYIWSAAGANATHKGIIYPHVPVILDSPMSSSREDVAIMAPLWVQGMILPSPIQGSGRASVPHQRGGGESPEGGGIPHRGVVGCTVSVVRVLREVYLL
jgi:hypothetical protein